jgi:hypothetical protein
MWKSFLIALLAVSARASDYPSSWKPTPSGKWGGLETLTPSDDVGDGNATEAINVFTDSGFLEKRTGNTLLFSSGIAISR